MEWIVVENNWHQAKEKIKAQWRTLTDHHVDAIEGKRDALVTRLQETLAVTPEEADRQVAQWESDHHDFFAETAEQVKPYLGIAKQ